MNEFCCLRFHIIFFITRIRLVSKMEGEMLIFTKWLKTKDANDMDSRSMSRFVFRMLVLGRRVRRWWVLGEDGFSTLKKKSWENLFSLFYEEITTVRESILSNEVNLHINFIGWQIYTLKLENGTTWKSANISHFHKVNSIKILPNKLSSICSQVLAQLVENAKIIRPDIHDLNSIPNHFTLCVWVYDGFVISSMYLKKKIIINIIW
jgi:hypothetical protein